MNHSSLGNDPRLFVIFRRGGDKILDYWELVPERVNMFWTTVLQDNFDLTLSSVGKLTVAFGSGCPSRSSIGLI